MVFFADAKEEGWTEPARRNSASLQSSFVVRCLLHGCRQRDSSSSVVNQRQGGAAEAARVSAGIVC